MTTTLAERVLEGEVLDGEVRRTLRVILLRSPFSLTREEHQVGEGLSLSTIIEQLGLRRGCTARVFIDDYLVPEAWWPRVRPRAGHVVTIRAVPMGGGGGEGKSWGQLILGVVLIIVGFVAAAWDYGALSNFLITAGIGMVIGGVVGLLFPPPQPGKFAGLSDNIGGKTSPSLSITGASNQAAPYAPIPRVYGRYRVFPPYGAQPYTESLGNDQYLRMLFVLGYGPLELSELKIGETPIEQFVGVETEIRQGYPTDLPVTLIPERVHEESLSIRLTLGMDPPVRVSRPEATELSVEISCPFGLYAISAEGDFVPQAVAMDVFYRAVGDTDWIFVDNLYTYANTQSIVRNGLRWATVAPDSYEVRLIPTIMPEAPTVKNITFWSAIRTITAGDVIRKSGLCLVAMRIKATDQLNGTIQTFNCIAQAILPDWDVPTQTWVARATSNPAAAYRDVLQGAANPRPVADDRLDLPALQDWWEECEAGGREFNAVVDFGTTVFQILRDIAVIGRGGVHMRDGKYSVVRDLLQTIPRAHFTPRNSSNFKGRKAFPDFPHALKVRFVNEESWQQDELYVYDDGYNADGSNGRIAATRFEPLDVWGCTSAAQAWKIARYHLASGRLRPEIYELTIDLEYLVVERGDLVKVTHDVPLWGLGSARVTSVTVDGSGNALSVTLDDLVPMASGNVYVARFRLQDGSSIVREVENTPGEWMALTLLTPVEAANAPRPGDLMQFGTLGSESVDVIVRSIEPQHDLTATLTFVDASPAIFDAETSAIPFFNPQISLPPLMQRQPAAPIIDSVTVIADRIIIGYHFASGATLMADEVQARFRIQDSNEAYVSVPSVAAESGSIEVSPVQSGQAYEILIRSVSRLGLASNWVTINQVAIADIVPPPNVPFFVMD